MFQLSRYLQRSEFQKLHYVGEALGLAWPVDMASILELEPDLVAHVTTHGTVPPKLPDHDKVHDRFYHLLALFAYLLKMADHREPNLRELWNDRAVRFYQGTKRTPPWLPVGLDAYLRTGKYDALQVSVDWIRSS
jgi:hypothetical protein